MFKKTLTLIALLLLCSCSSMRIVKIDKINAEDNQIITGLKIAIIADTHVTTGKLDKEFSFRSLLADILVNEATRTTAQEFLTLENLRYFFEDMKEQDPDIVLYLGDGMNSGCKDETETFFSQLEKSRVELDKPVFFVIGNHDYLASGNQTATDVRRETCGENNGFYSKAELIAKIDNFNRTSYVNFNKDHILTDFKDNIGTGAVNKSWEIKIDEACNQEDLENQHNDPDFRCFYAGIIKYLKNGVNGQIILTDSSDYRNIKVQPDLDLTELYGVRGSMSWEDHGQVDWINKNVSDSNDVRVIASHYNIEKLGYYPEYSFDRPGELLLKGENKNLWLSGHTHQEALVTTGYRFKDSLFFNEKTVYEINTGSTVDFSPHFTVIESHEKSVHAQSYPTAVSYGALQCESLVDSINLNSGYETVLTGSEGTRVQLGLTGDDRKK
ncbi:MAG: hypothetical protein D3910_22785, partial [Candidatus Electrothrix sp. ATG2]|nr:hypothetical protein [Candidatus Electrothrix sp. ATG2]